MSAATQARQAQLDRILDAQEPSQALADELFAVVGLLESQPTLRNALSDLTAPEEARQQLAAGVLTGQVSPAALAVVQAAAGLRWATSGALVGALERQGVRTLLRSAQAAGQLDQVEEELFRFSRIVAADRDLRATLEDRAASLAGRQQVIAELLAKKASAITVALAQRAVRATERTFELTLEAYLRLAAEQRRRAIAEVTVARPLTATQADRLRAALSRQVGREVSLQVSVDPAVLGGVRVKLGDEVIEGTVSGRLQAAERELN